MDKVKLQVGERLIKGRWSQVKFDACLKNIEQHASRLKVFKDLEGWVGARSPPRSEGPLGGLLFATKDMFHTQGLRTQYGCKGFEQESLDRLDAGLVSLFKKHGATHVGKTELTEFAMFTAAPSLNPHDTKRTPGGSSCGSAVAVSTQMVHAAIGSQTGGSMIRPAAYNGVLGFKPSWGLLPVSGALTLAPSMDTMGVFTSSIEDMLAIFDAFLVRTKRDEVSRDLRGVRIGFFRGESCPYFARTGQEVLECVGLVARAVKDLGAERKQVEFPKSFSPEGALSIMEFEIGKNMMSFTENDPVSKHMSRALLDKVRSWSEMSLEEVWPAYEMARQARTELDAIFEEQGVDYLLAPSTQSIAPLLSDCLKTKYPSGDPFINTAFTLMGNPCLHLPISTYQGMPLGLQMVGKRGKDLKLLDDAKRLLESLAAYTSVEEEKK